MQALGLDVAMPPFLDGQKQFSAEVGNQSRCITKVRWVVEAANRRIKEFKYFANTIQNSSLIYLESDLSIVCALINRYQPPIATSKPEDSQVGQRIMKLLHQKNKIQLLLEENNLIKRTSQWETINHDEIIDCFPIMSEEDVGDLTFGNKFSFEFYSRIYLSLGVFQLKRARSYAEEKCSTTDLTGIVDYTIQRCKSISNLIRVPTQSAHSNRITYHPTIQFTNEQILGWWCDCFTGARFLGCCSHISSAIWFLGCERWQTQKRHMPSGSYMNFATDAIQVSDFYDSSDGDNDDNSRYSLA
ncbi:unnamed protein product [Rotaria sp. Silwood1]|nr:unnamed protein product [Rotaria sp. Silwood1]CAF3872874.1 unnamed protein product [Rotaria sp. Silwood1]